MFFILITNNSTSNINKGMVGTSVGLILQSYGYSVTFLKAESILNVNPGKIEPSEQGEVFVLTDGSEVGLDLGNYERFCNVLLDKNNYLTAGSVLYNLIENEKNGNHNGKPLRYFTEFSNQVAQRLELLASTPACTYINEQKVYKIPDAIIVELEEPVFDEDSHSFLKAFSSFFANIEESSKCIISVNSAFDIQKELKENSSLNMFDRLKSYDLEKNICVLMGNVKKDLLNQISKNCDISPESIIKFENHRLNYSIPEHLYKSGLYLALKNKLNLSDRAQNFCIKEKFLKINTLYGRQKTIGLLTRYDIKNIPYISLEESLVIIGKQLDYDIEIKYINYQDLANGDLEAYNSLKSVDGILIPGGFGNQNVETKVMVAEYARTNNIPCLGICLGFQLMIIEYSRNVLEMKDATSEEFGEDSQNLVIRKHPAVICKNTSSDMFLGEYPVMFTGTFSEKFYKAGSNNEIFRHRYSLNPAYKSVLEKSGMKFEGNTDDGRGVAFILPGHSFYAGVQYHPELYPIPGNTDPILQAYIEAVVNHSK